MNFTCKLVVDEFSKVWVIPPPEEPQLPPALPLAAPPHAQHVSFQAVAEAAQNGVLFCHREEDGSRGGTLPHKPLPFDSCQVSLQCKVGEREREREIIRMKSRWFRICSAHCRKCVLSSVKVVINPL